MADHCWSYCKLCRRDIVVCGKCGKHCCNGEYGEVVSPIKVNGKIDIIECPACPSAYDMQNKNKENKLTDTNTIVNTITLPLSDEDAQKLAQLPVDAEKAPMIDYPELKEPQQ